MLADITGRLARFVASGGFIKSGTEYRMSKSRQLPSLPTSAKYLLGGGLLIASIIAWLVSLRAMTAMPSNIPGFVALWTVMMAAMMLPSVMPAVLLFATVAQSRTQFGFPAAPTAVFIGGDLGVWMPT